MGPEEEFLLYDRHDSWPVVFQQICAEALRKHNQSWRDSRQPEFRNRNRYRDVSPYDHSRVQLQRFNIDYINASLVQSPQAKRSYILTQGPLPHTSGHFWLMVWEQNSKAVLMLNRVIEKGQVKCHQYFPIGCENDGEDEMVFKDVGLKVIYVADRDSNFNYTVRILHVQDLETHETKEVIHFHYTTWPDFHVPTSPCAFLDFLFAVRCSGVLEPNVGPPVIHCSAGIGRSGTFCLVDTCLILIEKSDGASHINVRSILMDMRRYRMGLIQTHDQLRFSYLAIVEGTKRIRTLMTSTGCNGLEVNGNNPDSNDPSSADDESWPTDPPPPPPRLDRAIPHQGDTDEDPDVTWKRNNPDISLIGEPTILPGDPTKETILRTNQQEIRRRRPEERRKKTAEQIARMKERQKQSKVLNSRPRSPLGPCAVGLSIMALLGSYAFYRYFSA